MKTQLLIHPEELSKKWIDRMAAAGVNRLGIHPWGGKQAVDSINDLLLRLETDSYRGLIDYARSQGIEVEYELHAAGYLLPRGLFDTNPDWFRMDENGNRTPEYNFCVSDADALSLVAKNAAKLADKLYGSTDRFYFWMDDARDSKCNCEKCRGLSPSDQLLTVVNAMLGEIKKIRPHARMAYLAYQDTLLLPGSVKPRDGVFLEYAPFEKYTAKGDDRDMLIARERAMLPSLFEFFGSERAKLLEYWYDNSYFSRWKKPPVKFCVDKAAMAADMAEFCAFPFETVSSFACFLGEDYEALYGQPEINDFTAVLNKLTL